MRTITVGGRALPLDLRLWENDARKDASIVVLALAGVVVVSGLVLNFMLGEDSGTAILAFLAVLVLLFLFEVALHVLPRTTPAAVAAAPAEADPGAEVPPASPPTGVLTLKCGDCGTVFDVADSGTRPLYHTCPGCGAEGVLRGAPEAEAASAGLDEALGATAPAAPPPRAPIRRLKLRCAACKTVFSLDDFGDRPLKHECPGCGRAGELR